jgi:hypothetical protein
MKLESRPEKPFTIERAEEIRQEIEEVLALIKSGKVLGKDFEEKLKGLKKDLLELVRHHIIRREVITTIEIFEKSRTQSKELEERLSYILEVLESVFLDNLKNFLLNLHLAKSALEDPEAKSFGAEYLLYLNILNGVYQSIDSVLRKFPEKFFSFDEFLNYLIERISEALKALEALEGIEDKENIRRRLEKNLQDLKQKLEELTRGNL